MGAVLTHLPSAHPFWQATKSAWQVFETGLQEYSRRVIVPAHLSSNRALLSEHVPLVYGSWTPSVSLHAGADGADIGSEVGVATGVVLFDVTIESMQMGS